MDLDAGTFDLNETILDENRYIQDQQDQAFEFYDSHRCTCMMPKCYECGPRLEAEDDDGDGRHMELQENMDFAQDGDFENYVEGDF
jgi:hypothetical protein